MYLVATVLLVAAGVAKAARPHDTARALGSPLGLPVAVLRPAVRAIAAGEAALGAVGLAWPGRVEASLVAASYLTFAVVLTVVRVRGGALASCGCFGTPDTPVTVSHVAIDVGLGFSAAAVAAAGLTRSLPGVLGTQPWKGLPLAATSLLAAWLCLLVMDRLSRLVAVRRMVGITHPRRS